MATGSALRAFHGAVSAAVSQHTSQGVSGKNGFKSSVGLQVAPGTAAGFNIHLALLTSFKLVRVISSHL
jgi:hypothetical protein